jgi:hypothetical protein
MALLVFPVKLSKLRQPGQTNLPQADKIGGETNDGQEVHRRNTGNQLICKGRGV